MGIAYFELKKYRQACKHFENAQKINTDDIIAEYLYYSYLYGGRSADAAKMAVNMHFDLKRKLELEGKMLSVTTAFFSNPTKNYESLIVSDLNGVEDIGGQQTIVKSKTQGKINFQLRNKTGLADFGYSYLHSSNFLRLALDADSLGEIDGKTNQHTFNYLNTFALNSRFNLFAGLSLLTGNADNIDYTSTTVAVGRRQTTQNGYYLATYTYADWQLVLGAEFKSSYFDFNINVAYHNFGTTTNYQVEVQPTFYPFGNLNLYISPGFILKPGTNSESLTKIKAGFGIANKVWLEAGLWSGNISYFSSDLGQFIYNNDEQFKSKQFVSLIIPIKRAELILSYESIHANVPYTYDETSLITSKIYKAADMSLIYAGIKFNIN
jgi:hypothetical protein